jgi:uncharacterized membrane protein
VAIEYAPGQKTISAKTRIAMVAIVGALVFLAVSTAVSLTIAPLIAWDSAALIFMIWVWSTVWSMDGHLTAKFAVREDPSRGVTDLIMLAASVASLVSVGLVLLRAGHSHGTAQLLQIALGAVSVIISWAVLHTLYTLHYARLYYTEPVGGVDIQGEKQPSYSDFAYLAFTLGMTFQVSDTGFKNQQFRKMAFKHALLSYLFGTIIVATTINLIAGLTK